MSGQGKPHRLQDHAHKSATRPASGPQYATAQPGFALEVTQSGSTREPYSLLTDEPANYTYGSENVNYLHNYGSYMYARSRHPEITSYVPQTGIPGTKLYVYFQHTQDLNLLPHYFSVIFREKSVAAELMIMQQTEHFFQYAVSVDVPTLDETPLESIPLYFSMHGESDSDLVLFEFGSFLYTSHLRHPTTSSSHDLSRKRKVSSDTSYIAPQPAKRPSTQRLHDTAKEQSAMYAVSKSQAQSPSPASQYHTVPHGVPVLTERARTVSNPSMPPAGDYGAAQDSRTISRTQSQVPDEYPADSNSTGTPPLSHHIPSVTVATRTKPKMPSTSGSRTPQLIRTSTLPPSPASRTSVSSQAFNPYSMYPHKAVLKIEGDLDAMADNWTDAEWDTRRRLVQFERSQSGSTITTSFKSVTLEERAPNSICISCILWEERGECFVTSVDTIYLLESLVAVRFTVEEKNRIRRNLEGFRPLTVSKSKTKEDSEEFFKVVMGFPNPKPRNIEKDVKVFPWKILAHALKKIISKYSASYSSTAGALLPYPTSGPSNRRSSDGGSDSPSTARPELLSSPAPSIAAGKSSTSLSPAMQAPVGPQASAGPFEQRFVTPTSGALQSGYRRYGPVLDTRYLAVPATADAWNFGHYVDPNTTTLVASSTMPRYGSVRYEQPAASDSQQHPPHLPHHAYEPYDHQSHPT